MYNKLRLSWKIIDLFSGNNKRWSHTKQKAFQNNRFSLATGSAVFMQRIQFWRSILLENRNTKNDSQTKKVRLLLCMKFEARKTDGLEREKDFFDF